MQITKPLVAIFVTCTLFTTAAFSKGSDTFKKKCAACHTMTEGAKSMGPNLYKIAETRPEEYLKTYMTNPEEARKKYPDIYAEFAKKYSMKMPAVKLSQEEIDAIYEALK